MFAWKLGFLNQLIVIGILLRVMTECLQVIITDPLLLLEYRYGHSRLQNYEAILRNSYLVSRSSLRTRITIVFLLVVPFVLSAVYKLFSGGESSREILSQYGNKTYPRYGITPPPLNEYAGFNNSIYYFTNAYADFHLAVTKGEQGLPTIRSQQAAPYGHNLLLLSENSAVALDMPLPAYTSSLQSGLVEPDKLKNIYERVRLRCNTKHQPGNVPPERYILG